MNPLRSTALVVSLAAADYKVPQKNLGFPTYKNAPPGEQMSGQQAPATTPALSPEKPEKIHAAAGL